jgi:N-acetylmuramoyl-L-alanine amidase
MFIFAPQKQPIMLPITRQLLTSRRNRPALENAEESSLRQLKGVVAHWTANENKGANAVRNRDYFNTTDRFASAHYIVDDAQIVQCVPDCELAWHVGSKNYKPDGERIREGSFSPNYFLIGFEMCVNSDGNWAKTYQNSVELAAHLLVKFDLKTTDLYRHFDITGKDCPKMMIESAKWTAFKTAISKEILKINAVEKPVASGRTIEPDLNVRAGAGKSFAIKNRLEIGTKIQIFERKNGWVRIGKSLWVSGQFVEILFENQKLQVAAKTGANIRNKPSGEGTIIDELPFGVPVLVIEKKEKWCKIGENRWAHESLFAPIIAAPPPPPPAIPTAKVVGTDALNVRKGAGTNFELVKKLPVGSIVQLLETAGLWVRIAKNEWVFGAFLQRN